MMLAWFSSSLRIGVLVAEDRLEQAAVGVPAGAVEDGVVLAEEAGDGRFQLLVQLLRAADEAHRGHAVAVAAQPLVGRLDDGGMVGQTEIIVGAEVDDLAAADADVRALAAPGAGVRACRGPWP